MVNYIITIISASSEEENVNLLSLASLKEESDVIPLMAGDNTERAADVASVVLELKRPWKHYIQNI